MFCTHTHMRRCVCITFVFDTVGCVSWTDANFAKAALCGCTCFRRDSMICIWYGWVCHRKEVLIYLCFKSDDWIIFDAVGSAIEIGEFENWRQVLTCSFVLRLYTIQLVVSLCHGTLKVVGPPCIANSFCSFMFVVSAIAFWCFLLRFGGWKSMFGTVAVKQTQFFCLEWLDGSKSFKINVRLVPVVPRFL